MHANYQVPQLAKARDTLIRTAPSRQVEQSNRVERLIAELNPEKSYTYGYLYTRITSDQPASGDSRTKILGKDAQHDLRLLAEDLTDLSPPLADKAGERVLTVEELSDAFNVSQKTISRWRQQGLVSRWYVVDGRKRVGFLQSSVDRFVREHEDRVRRGSQFTKMTHDEKNNVVDSARQLARLGGKSTGIIRDLAKRTGRSVEAIRYTLKHFDQRHPGDTVLPSANTPLLEETKKLIYQQYRRGTAVDELAARHNRTRQSIYRIIGEMRARRIAELPLDYTDNPSFTDADAAPWAADTSQGRMVGDYISTSWLGGRAFGAFAVASAPSGSVFDEPIAVPAGGLVAAAGGFVNNASGEHPVANAASDHASPRSAIRHR